MIFLNLDMSVVISGTTFPVTEGRTCPRCGRREEGSSPTSEDSPIIAMCDLGHYWVTVSDLEDWVTLLTNRMVLGQLRGGMNLSFL